jgi:hypothetical protein
MCKQVKLADATHRANPIPPTKQSSSACNPVERFLVDVLPEAAVKVAER